VLTLEQSVAELHQMFLDFALLTEQQGELLDQIEFQVKNAADHVEDANVDVHEAIEYQKAIRKKQWCAMKKSIIPSCVLFGMKSHILLCDCRFVMQLDHSYCYRHTDHCTFRDWSIALDEILWCLRMKVNTVVI
jgi:hypothetical protein